MAEGTMPGNPESSELLSGLAFRQTFRKYQQMILDQAACDQGDYRYHLVAPPGSGKTIVGLELIRRFGYPAVVFAPTTTIQVQWREQLEMFCVDRHVIDRLVSLDPTHLAPINVFTYQLISTPGESLERVNEITLARWAEELVVEGRAADAPAARRRLATMRENNPAAFRKELASRYLRTKRELLHADPAGIGEFLHHNSLKLIGRLLDSGVRTVVLDECHHLLDYWAIVLRHLIGKIQDPRVVGLTATLPNPENERAFENYSSLLGEVDFEVPTPAVVKEGDLAPYRDLVYFVKPTPREMDYLHGIQTAFENAISELSGSAAFQDWVAKTIFEHRAANGEAVSWEEFLREWPNFSLAGMRFLKRISAPFPEEAPLLPEAEEDLNLEDWAVLLERYGLDVLKLSPNASDHSQLRALRKTLLSFGLTLTERGLRQSRSPGDLILTFSEAKDWAVADILSAEHQAMGDKLRAVVVTDFERMGSAVRGLRGVLDRDAGSAHRVFAYLVAHPRAGLLDPILATGRTLLVDADLGARLLERFNQELKESKAKAKCAFKPTASPKILEVVGEGRDWSPSVYVHLVTGALERAETRCLVGTRGIFGEGWDSLTLNTLIDLTSVTTSTSVQQLRGRSIRLDPSWPKKVAHNWDVICVAKEFRKGDTDLRRFVDRHGRYWGVVPVSRLQQAVHDAMASLESLSPSAPMASARPVERPTTTPDALGGELRGQVVKGVSHVSPDLAYKLAVRGFHHIDFDGVTQHMLSQVKRREEDYELWGVGEEYSNFSYTTTRLDGEDLKIRTVFSMQETLKRMLRSFRASLLAGILLAGWLWLQPGLRAAAEGAELSFLLVTLLVFLVAGFVLSLLLNLRAAFRLGRALLVDQPADAVLLDIGRAVAEALLAARLVSRNLRSDYVRVIDQPDHSYQVLLDYASPEDAAVFVEAYRQVFEPIRNQRYLILRTDDRLPNLALGAFWLAMRRLFRSRAGYPPAFHPVPKVLASEKDRAEQFAACWKKYVGGGQLIYAHSEEGRRIILRARTQRRPNVKDLAFEIWR